MPLAQPTLQLRETWQPVINLGLPRTGTSSFASASLRVGMRTAHACTSAHPVKDLGEHFYDGVVKGWCRLEGGSPGEKVPRRSIDSHSDIPWFMVNASRLRTAFPMAGLVCSTRSAESLSLIHI